MNINDLLNTLVFVKTRSILFLFLIIYVLVKLLQKAKNNSAKNKFKKDIYIISNLLFVFFCVLNLKFYNNGTILSVAFAISCITVFYDVVSHLKQREIKGDIVNYKSSLSTKSVFSNKVLFTINQFNGKIEVASSAKEITSFPKK